MAHDIFISYSSKDKPIADGICANLEAAGLRCWIAPRDLAAGDDWPTTITHSRVRVLIFSANSRSSSKSGFGVFTDAFAIRKHPNNLFFPAQGRVVGVEYLNIGD